MNLGEDRRLTFIHFMLMWSPIRITYPSTYLPTYLLTYLPIYLTTYLPSTTMSFDILVDEIIVKIFHCLMDDPISFLSFASTCKRFCLIANRRVIQTPQWVQARPLAFNLYLETELYLPHLCGQHGLCAEQKWRTGFKCELETKNHSTSAPSTTSRTTSSGDSSEDKNNCYYHRLFCMLNSKHRSFSSLKFRDARLSDRGCVKSFQDTLKLNQSLGELKIKALVELELYNCDITLDWLNTILNETENISYLALNSVAFIDPSILVEPRHLASKTLKRLRISGDRSCRINDSIFMYFLENFPAVQLDLTGTRVEYHKRIIQRFYTNANTVDLFSVRPSEYILTFPMVLLYLRKYQAVAKQFIASETDITFTCLKRILQEDDLKHLQIDIRNCPMITQFERTRLADHVDEADLARVLF